MAKKTHAPETLSPEMQLLANQGQTGKPPASAPDPTTANAPTLRHREGTGKFKKAPRHK